MDENFKLKDLSYINEILSAPKTGNDDLEENYDYDDDEDVYDDVKNNEEDFEGETRFDDEEHAAASAASKMDDKANHSGVGKLGEDQHFSDNHAAVKSDVKTGEPNEYIIYLTRDGKFLELADETGNIPKNVKIVKEGELGIVPDGYGTGDSSKAASSTATNQSSNTYRSPYDGMIVDPVGEGPNNSSFLLSKGGSSRRESIPEGVLSKVDVSDVKDKLECLLDEQSFSQLVDSQNPVKLGFRGNHKTPFHAVESKLSSLSSWGGCDDPNKSYFQYANMGCHSPPAPAFKPPPSYRQTRSPCKTKSTQKCDDMSEYTCSEDSYEMHKSYYSSSSSSSSSSSCDGESSDSHHCDHENRECHKVTNHPPRHRPRMTFHLPVVCNYCNKRLKKEKDYKTCGGCKQAHYCSTDCAKKAWGEYHKDHCQKIQAFVNNNYEWDGSSYSEDSIEDEYSYESEFDSTYDSETSSSVEGKGDYIISHQYNADLVDKDDVHLKALIGHQLNSDYSDVGARRGDNMALFKGAESSFDETDTVKANGGTGYYSNPYYTMPPPTNLQQSQQMGYANYINEQQRRIYQQQQQQSSYGTMPGMPQPQPQMSGLSSPSGLYTYPHQSHHMKQKSKRSGVSDKTKDGIKKGRNKATDVLKGKKRPSQHYGKPEREGGLIQRGKETAERARRDISQKSRSASRSISRSLSRSRSRSRSKSRSESRSKSRSKSRSENRRKNKSGSKEGKIGDPYYTDIGKKVTTSSSKSRSKSRRSGSRSRRGSSKSKSRSRSRSRSKRGGSKSRSRSRRRGSKSRSRSRSRRGSSRSKSRSRRGGSRSRSRSKSSSRRGGSKSKSRSRSRRGSSRSKSRSGSRRGSSRSRSKPGSRRGSSRSKSRSGSRRGSSRSRSKSGSRRGSSRSRSKSGSRRGSSRSRSKSGSRRSKTDTKRRDNKTGRTSRSSKKSSSESAKRLDQRKKQRKQQKQQMKDEKAEKKEDKKQRKQDKKQAKRDAKEEQKAQKGGEDDQPEGGSGGGGGGGAPSSDAGDNGNGGGGSPSYPEEFEDEEADEDFDQRANVNGDDDFGFNGDDDSEEDYFSDEDYGDDEFADSSLACQTEDEMSIDANMSIDARRRATRPRMRVRPRSRSRPRSRPRPIVRPRSRSRSPGLIAPRRRRVVYGRGPGGRPITFRRGRPALWTPPRRRWQRPGPLSRRRRRRLRRARRRGIPWRGRKGRRFWRDFYRFVGIYPWAAGSPYLFGVYRRYYPDVFFDVDTVALGLPSLPIIPSYYWNDSNAMGYTINKLENEHNYWVRQGYRVVPNYPNGRFEWVSTYNPRESFYIQDDISSLE